MGPHLYLPAHGPPLMWIKTVGRTVLRMNRHLPTDHRASARSKAFVAPTLTALQLLSYIVIALPLQLAAALGVVV